MRNGNTALNSGTITVGNGGVGIVGFANNTFTNVGTINSTATAAIGIVLNGDGNTAINTGTIALTGSGSTGVHAYGDGHDRPSMEVEAHPALDGEGLSVVVRDHGRGIMPRAESTGLGLGLPLIAALTRTVEIRRASEQLGGTEVVMAFALDETAIEWKERM